MFVEKTVRRTSDKSYEFVPLVEAMGEDGIIAHRRVLRTTSPNSVPPPNSTGDCQLCGGKGSNQIFELRVLQSSAVAIEWRASGWRLLASRAQDDEP